MPSNHATLGDLTEGGDFVEEDQCGLAAAPCQFQAFPGTVGWFSDFLSYSNAHFKKVRNGFVHYVFYAHSRGKAKAFFPCLDSLGQPTTYSDGTRVFGPSKICAVGSPVADFRVPSGSTGVAQFPGGKALVSVGLWDPVNHVASAELNAGTTLHELGHNGKLPHGGGPPVWNPTNRVWEFERNCKPNHVSVMSYLFQAIGLRDDNGGIHFDYSRHDENGKDIDETLLSDGYALQGPPSPQPFYRTARFAPLLPGTLGVSSEPPKRDGSATASRSRRRR